MDAAPVRAEWLGWDGTRLQWRLHGDLAGIAATELRIDDIVFQRYPASDAAQADFECAFGFSPSGADSLSFSLTLANTSPSEALAVWHVNFGQMQIPGTSSASRASTLQPLRASSIPARTLASLPPVAVVVPIYNSLQCVKRCIESVLRFSPEAQLILVDDASTDAQISALLDAAARHANVTTHRNVRNRGYTYSVNVGMGLAGGADVVLLNSDAVVGPRWLSALRIAAYSAENVGTVTAVSDNAGAFSVPEIEQTCPIPPRWNLVETQRALLQRAGPIYLRMPTGNGFCMFIKRALIARIGPMDETAFPQGYGEENDFCQRTLRAGFENLVASNVLVHHERSASFGDARRAALGAQGMAVLRERYPDYERDVGVALQSFERHTLDYRVRRIYAGLDDAVGTPRPRLLVAADAGDADAGRLLGALEARHQGYLLLREGAKVNLYNYTKQLGAVFESGLEIGDDAGALARIEATLREWLVIYAIEAVHARGSAAQDDWLARLAATLDIPTM